MLIKIIIAIALLCINLAPALASSSPLRLWIDEYAFAKGETQILREAVAANNKAVSIIGSSYSSTEVEKSIAQLHQIDLYWTGRKGCYHAFQYTSNSRSRAISCVPGTQAITGKASLVKTLVAAYGSAAYNIIPQSFLLPAQYYAFAQEVASSGDAWVLKEDAHRGKGVHVAQGQELLRKTQERSSKTGANKYIMAQKFIKNQYLVHDRPFYIRLWAVVVGGSPIRTYLFNGGVVVFGQEQSQLLKNETTTSNAAESMIVNLWIQDRKAAAPWSVPQLRRHIDDSTGSPDAFNRLWKLIEQSIAATVAASTPAIRTATSKLPGYQQGGFEFQGFDFLVDQDLYPWLVEVNWLPSLARKNVGCTGSHCQQDNPFDVQKELFVNSLLQLFIRTRNTEQQAAINKQAVAATDHLREIQKPCLNADQLARLVNTRIEGSAAAELGFSVLTRDIYSDIYCMSNRTESACSQLPRVGTLLDLDNNSAAGGGGFSSSSHMVGLVRRLLRSIPGLRSLGTSIASNQGGAMTEYDSLIQPYITAASDGSSTQGLLFDVCKATKTPAHTEL